MIRMQLIEITVTGHLKGKVKYGTDFGFHSV